MNRVRALCGAALLAAMVGAGRDSGPRVVVVDPGHGGPDHGARAHGLTEKDLVLSVARELGKQLERRGFKVVFTRTRDEFVSLPERTDIANRARGDLFLSIHANSAPASTIRGTETYFLSVEASDEDARRVALTENDVFAHRDAVPDSGDLVGAILGDLIRTEHLRASSEAAAAIQRELSQLEAPGRGVKQAPFVVLMGVNMPATLIEIGFVTHSGEARQLGTGRHQRAIAAAVAKAVAAYGASQVAASADREAQ